MQGYSFDKETAQDILEMLREWRRDSGKKTLRANTNTLTAPTHPVRVTSTTTVSDRYPGKWLTYDAEDKTFADQDEIWVVDVNDSALSVQRYMGRYSGFINGRHVYSVRACA